MLMSDVMSITLSIVGFLISLQGLWLVSRALWPNRVDRTIGRIEHNAIKSFLVGIPVTLATFILVALLGKLLGAVGQFSAFALACLYVVYANVGVAGLVTHIGNSLPSPADAARPWKATVRGGVALELAYLIPILGWLGLLPGSLILGAGAMTLALRKAKPVRQLVPPIGLGHEPGIPSPEFVSRASRVVLHPAGATS